MQRYYRTIIWLVVIIMALALIVVILSQPTETQSAIIATSTSPITIAPIQTTMITVTQNDSNMTINLGRNENFILNLGALKWNIVFTPDDIIGRISDTKDGAGQGIYQAFNAGTTTLHGTGAPICKSGQMCPDFMEAMTITFVVQ